MRVTQNIIYSNIIARNNRALADLQESNLQSVTQKKVNRPSDNPTGTANIYDLRASLETLDNYYSNAKTATGWLTLADGVLQQLSNMIIEAKTYDLQGATGTVNADNREQISSQLRQYYEQMIVLANSSYNGEYIFAGHKTTTTPYQQSMSAMSYDKNLDGVDFSVTGDNSHSVVVQFLSGGEIGTGSLDFRYSKDGGKTWQNGTLPAGAGPSFQMDLDGLTVNLHNAAGKTVTAVDTENLNENDNGTWLWVYPTGQYYGDDNDKIWVDSYGAAGVTAEAEGSFAREVVVRVDEVAGSVITYSYSTDAGNSWVQGNTGNDDGSGNTRLLVPGGYLNLTGAGGLAAGDQFFIRSRRADINLDISKGQSLTINNVGKEIFGGIYQDPDNDYPTAADSISGANLLESMGRLIAFAENNNQQGFQQELENLKAAHNHMLTKAATIGGRMNRASVSQKTIELISASETQNLSSVEDIDYIELMTKIAQQELVYQSALKSSSMLMQLSLLNFI